MTTRSICFILLFSLVFSFSVYGKPPKWYSNLQKIKLLETRKSEIEMIFNNPAVTSTSDWETRRSVEYKINVGKLTVIYSLGRCSDNLSYGYNVEKDTVISIDVELSKQVIFSSLGIKLSDFDKHEISDLPGVFTYANSDFSRRFTGTNSKISDFTLEPNEQYESLLCKNLR